MGRRIDVAYIASDNAQWPASPSDQHLRQGKAFLQTYFRRPLGPHTEVVCVRNFREVIDDLTSRLGRRDRVGNVLVFLHGQPMPGGGMGIKMPIRGQPGPSFIGHDATQVTDQLDMLYADLQERRKTRRALRRLTEKQLDAQSTLTFLGCSIGTEQQILDEFRKFLGGQLTVFAPKLVHTLQPKSGDLDRPGVMATFVDDLIALGLLAKTSPDALFDRMGRRLLQTQLRQRLDQVLYTAPNEFAPRSLLEHGLLLFSYLVKEGGNEHDPRQWIPAFRQEMGKHWAASTPPGARVSGTMLMQRLRQTLPGWAITPPHAVLPEIEGLLAELEPAPPVGSRRTVDRGRPPDAGPTVPPDWGARRHGVGSMPRPPNPGLLTRPRPLRPRVPMPLPPRTTPSHIAQPFRTTPSHVPRARRSDDPLGDARRRRAEADAQRRRLALDAARDRRPIRPRPPLRARPPSHVPLPRTRHLEMTLGPFTTVRPGQPPRTIPGTRSTTRWTARW